MKTTDLISEYQALGIDGTIDHDTFNSISIVHHSAALEGSTLTEAETAVLLNNGLTPGGRPLEHSLMVADHFNALKFAIEEAGKKTPLSVGFLQQIAGMVLKHTGVVYRTALGDVDATKGGFRKGNVAAGQTYFPNYDKVEKLTEELVQTINGKMAEGRTMEEKLMLSFDAHFNLVSIHPFYDGNGRTSRLLMNYIQHYYGLPLAVVRSESKSGYIESLAGARKKQDIGIFRDFMASQYAAQLEKEIESYKNAIEPKKGSGFRLLF